MKNIIVEEQIKISAKYLFRLGPTIGIFYFFFINKIEAINYELKDWETNYFLFINFNWNRLSTTTTSMQN